MNPTKSNPESLNALHWVACTGRCDPKKLKDKHFALAVKDGLITQEMGLWQPTAKGERVASR